MNEITNILIKSNFNVSQIKLLLALTSFNPKTTTELADHLEFTPKKLVNEIKKIENDEIEITLDESLITIEIGLNKYELVHEKNTRTKLVTKADEKEMLAKSIFDFWKSTMLNPNGKMKKTQFSTYRSVILGALKNYTENELRDAILGCSKSLWHMGYDDKGNPTNKKYDGLDLILRATKIEGFIAKKDDLSIEDQLNNINNKNNPLSVKSEDDRDFWAEKRNRLLG